MAEAKAIVRVHEECVCGSMVTAPDSYEARWVARVFRDLHATCGDSVPPRDGQEETG